VVARVNGGEITVHQVNFVLEGGASHDTWAGMGAGATESADDSHATLDRLIDQEVLVQAAIAQKLDRNPQVLAALELARRSVLANAYMEQLRGASVKPGIEDIQAYYRAHPALFSERRVYTLREFRISSKDGTANHVLEARLRSAWEQAHDWGKLLDAAGTGTEPYASSMVVLAAEQLPLEDVEAFQKMQVGAVHFFTTDDGLRVQQVVKIANQPMVEATAAPMIQAYLVAQTRQQAALVELARLRQAARIDRIGDFAEDSTNQNRVH
jgi:EpsD family peptidyl-prolyl cis-trans isomerase